MGALAAITALLESCMANKAAGNTIRHIPRKNIGETVTRPLMAL
jgi:hypothetical protein